MVNTGTVSKDAFAGILECDSAVIMPVVTTKTTDNT